MRGDSVLPEDKFFQTNDEKKIWQRYCGFLDLSLEEFMEIQNRLLIEQMELVASSILGKKIMKGNSPKTIDEFRRLVPLTAYEDYEPYLSEKQEDALAEKPLFWCHSSGRSGKFKWIPYTERAIEVITKRAFSLFLLASAYSKGDINVRPGCRVLLILPPRPYMSGSMLHYVSKRLSLQIIPPQDDADETDFQKGLAQGFNMALDTGVDVILAIASVLVKMGETMTEQAHGKHLSRSMMLRPRAFPRFVNAYLRSKIARRPILPKDIWHAKAVIPGGIDAHIYKDKIAYYWGQTPYDNYSCTEVSFIAMQAWNKKWMTLVPDCSFFEFIPEEERQKIIDNPGYQPKTVLINEVQPGKTYEVVVTHFYGMPLLRYRLNDLVTFVALGDEEAGIKLPQLVFKARAADVIPLSGLAQLDEKTIWQAIDNTGLKNDGWTVLKEYDNNHSYLRFYLELKETREVGEIERIIDQQLQDIDIDYSDLDKMLGLNPVRVTLLSSGTFQRYYEEKRREGAALAHLKPPHINAPDAVMRKLLQLSDNSTIKV
jgi:phenylacetate-coenzyme A ligase PaaK-like adenylate-forming protein